MTRVSTEANLHEAAERVHRAAIVWDNHVCLSYRHRDLWLEDLESFRRGNVDVISINVGDSNDPLDVVISHIAAIRSFVRSHPDLYTLATTTDEIIEAKASGRIAVLLDVEGVFSIGENLDLIELYYDLGVRWMLMVYNRRNLAGSGVHDEADAGLTAFGRSVVREMDRVGLVKCCSHTGYRTAMDVLTSTSRPTIFSHSNPRALWEHPRNITDELIDACAATGGVVCLTGVGIFLGDNDPSVSRLADHIEYVLDRAGPEHVGLGLDFPFDHGELKALAAANSNTFPPGCGYELDVRFYAPHAVGDITTELLRRGRPLEEIEGVLGGNLMRVARQVWR